MRVGHQLRCVAVLIVAAVSLAACSDPVPAAKVPRRSATPIPASSSPSPTPSTPEQEVEAAVREYYAELNRAVQTNDTSRLKKLIHKNCPCYNAVKIIERNKSKRLATPDAEFSLQAVRAHDVVGKSAAAEVRFSVTPYDVLTEDGDVTGRVKRASHHWDLILVQFGDVWTVTNLFDLEAP